MQVSEETQQFLDEGIVAARAHDGGDWRPHTIRPPQQERLALYDHTRRVFFEGVPAATALGWSHWRPLAISPQDGPACVWTRCDNGLPDLLYLEFSKVWVAHRRDDGSWDVDMCDVPVEEDEGDPFNGLNNMRLVHGDEHVWWAPIVEPMPPKA